MSAMICGDRVIVDEFVIHSVGDVAGFADCYSDRVFVDAIRGLPFPNQSELNRNFRGDRSFALPCIDSRLVFLLCESDSDCWRSGHKLDREFVSL